MSANIYDIYVRYHLNETGDHTVTSERLLYSIPIEDSSRALIDPVVKCEMGKAGSFEFSMPPTHPFYNLLQQMKTVMRVEYNGNNIFRGRVLTIDTNRLTGIRKVHLEGDLAFLNDSYQEGVDEGDRPKTSVYDYLKNIIKQHNDQMDVSGSTYKKFTLGIVPGCPNYTSLTRPAQRISIENSKFGDSSWKKTQEAINGLAKDYGGYFRTRYENGTCYLDWLETYFTQDVGSQPIRVARNLIDLNDTSEVDNIFTYVIPIGTTTKGKKIYIDEYKENIHGANRSISVPTVASWLRSQGRTSELNRGFHNESDYDNAIEKYGVIYRTQEFGDATTKEKLWNAVVNWVRDNYVGGITSFTATAVDMHHVYPDHDEEWLVGKQVTIIYPKIDEHATEDTPTESRTITLLTANYVLHNPEKNQYTIGIPSSLLSKAYRSKSKKTKNDATSSGITKDNETHNTEEIRDLTEAAKAFIISKKYNIDEYNTLVAEDPKKAQNAIDLSTIHVRQVLEDKQSEGMTLEQISHDKTSKDVGSIYVATNGTQWKIASVYNRKLKVTPVVSKSKLPSSGTLTWVSGGENHSAITYGKSTSDVFYNLSKTLTMKVEGNEGKITVGMPIDESHIITDEDAAKINKIKDTLTLNAAEGAIEIKDLLPMAPDPSTVLTPKTRLQMQVNDSLKSGEVKAYGANKTADDNAPPTVSLFGSNGATAAIQGLFGKDGSGEQSVVDILGEASKLVMRDPSKAGSENENDKVVEVQGQSGGEIGVGKKTDSQHPETKKWMITMNKNLKWKDSSGTEHTVPSGTVGAEDYYLDDIPSFHTEFAYINRLLADYIDTKDLVVRNHAFINDLTGNSAVIDKIIADKVYGGSWMSAPEMRSSSYRLIKGDGDLAYLQNCISDVMISKGTGADAGKIFFDFYKIGGGSLPTKNFNIADTQFYKDAVSAAKDEGSNRVTVGVIISTPPSGTTADRTINPGQWVKAGGTYTNKDGLTTSIDSVKWVKANEDANLVPANIRSGTTIFGVEGSYSPRLQTKGPIAPTTSDMDITPTSGYDGLSKVTIMGDSDLIPANIKSGVTLFGVEGSYSPRLQTKGPIAPTTSDRDITPTSGYDGLAKVTIMGDSDLVSANIKNGVTLFGVEGKYKGNIRKVESSVMPTTVRQIISPGTDSSGVAYDGWDCIAVRGDSNLKAENIVKGKSIFGVAGSYEVKLTTRGPVAPGTSDKTITPTGDYAGFSKFIVAGDADLVPANIKSGVTLFGVTGTYNGSASSSDIRISSQPKAQIATPSGTQLNYWKSVILEAIEYNNYFVFETWLSNNVSDKKRYYVKF